MEMSRTTIGTGQCASGARALAALALALSLGAGWMLVRAGDGAHLESGGGDTVGSLPLMAGPPPPECGAGGCGENSLHAVAIGPNKPMAILVGARQDVLAAILDAQPTGADGSYRLTFLPNDQLQVEL